VLRAALIVGLLLLARAAGATTCTWQGGSGDWADGAHWSCGSAPTSADACVIDASSGTGTIDASGLTNADCGTLTESAGATIALRLPSASLRISGSVVFDAGVLVDVDVTSSLGFELIGTGGANTISGALGCTSVVGGCAATGTLITVNTPGGTYSFASAFSDDVVNLSIFDGTLDTAGFAVTAGSWLQTQSMGILTLGASAIVARELWDANTVPIVAGSSTVACRGRSGVACSWQAQGNTFNGVVWQPNDAPVVYPNLYYLANWSTDTLGLDPGVSANCGASPSTVATIGVGTLSCTGTAGNYIELRADASVGSTITLAMTNQPVCDYLILADIPCTVGGNPPWPTPGGTPCIAGTNSIDLGGNVGWLFGATPPNPTLTPTPTVTLTPTPTASATDTATRTATVTATVTKSATATPTLPPGCCVIQTPNGAGNATCVDNTIPTGTNINSMAACNTVGVAFGVTMLNYYPANCLPSPGDFAGFCLPPGTCPNPTVVPRPALTPKRGCDNP